MLTFYPFRRLMNLFGFRTHRPPAISMGGKVIDLLEPQADDTASKTYDWFKSQLDIAQDRHQRYRELQQMDDGDIISSALDLYAEDATQLDPGTGRSIWVVSKNKEVEKIANATLERVDMEGRVFSITRGVAKYGDHFESLLLGMGDNDIPTSVAGMKTINPIGVSRIEDELGRLLGFRVSEISEEQQFEDMPQPAVAAGDITLPWEILHFRLMAQSVEDERYGTSMLSASRRVYRYLRLMEESMVIYRLRRAPDRLKWSVYTGSASPEEAAVITNTFRQRLRKRMATDPDTGHVKSELNPLCFTGDTRVSLLDGTEVPIKDLVSRDPFWVYSYDHESGKIVPGKATALGVTGKNAKLVEVELDNGEYVRCTPDHLWMLRDGSYRVARDLKSGDSLMPLYRKYTHTTLDGYELLRQPVDDKWRFTHRQVTGSVVRGYIVHHENFNCRDNRPENLEIMTREEHTFLHLQTPETKEKVRLAKVNMTLEERIAVGQKVSATKLSKSPEEREAFRQTCISAQLDPDVRRSKSSSLQEYWDGLSAEEHEARTQLAREASQTDEVSAQLSDSGRRAWASYTPEEREVRIQSAREGVRRPEVRKKISVNARLGKARAKRQREERASQLMASALNHIVVAVRFLEEREDVYDIYVEKYHNFALTVGVFVHNCLDEDIFIPFGDGPGRHDVDMMKGSTDVGDVLDIDYMRKRLFSCMRIPPDYMGFEEAGGTLSGRSPLSDQDVRFARGEKRLQRATMEGVTTLIKIDMLLRGMDVDREENEFALRMHPVSFLEELQRVEVAKNRAEIVATLVRVGHDLGGDKSKWMTYVAQQSGFPEELLQSVGSQLEQATTKEEAAQILLEALTRHPTKMPAANELQSKIVKLPFRARTAVELTEEIEYRREEAAERKRQLLEETSHD